MPRIPERCEACDAVIGNVRAYPHCGCIRPNAKERAEDGIRLVIAFILAVLWVIGFSVLDARYR